MTFISSRKNTSVTVDLYDTQINEESFVPLKVNLPLS
jgi:hypothetical protein